MIKEYADKIKLYCFALALAPVQHIGIYSSYDNLEINTQSTWALQFEENDANALRQEHELLLEMKDVPWLEDVP